MQLSELIMKLNNRDLTIKFYIKYPKTSIEFLSTTIYKYEEQIKLLKTVYHEPTDQINFMHYTSVHSKSLLKISQDHI